jgi:hypothetical protein
MGQVPSLLVLLLFQKGAKKMIAAEAAGMPPAAIIT